MQNEHTMMISRGDTAVRVVQCDFCARWEGTDCPGRKDEEAQSGCGAFVRCDDVSQRLDSLLA